MDISIISDHLKDYSLDDYEKRFGESLRLHLEINEITQRCFAKVMKVSQPVISRYINRIVTPDFITALKIANYFGHNLYGFMGLPAPNTINERSLFYKFIKELQALIHRYVSPKNGSFRFETEKSNNHMSKLMVTYDHSIKSIYPLADGGYSRQGGYTVCDSYLIVNENIYPERHFELLWSYENEHLSFFDYTNNILDHEENHSCIDERYEKLKRMMNVFAQNRHLFGVLGTLTASKFYWLVYLMAYKNKFVAYPTE